MIIHYLSLTAPLFALVGGWRRRFTPLWLYAMAGLLSDWSSEVLKRSGYEFKYIGNIFILIELVVITILYHKKLFKSGYVFVWFMAIAAILFILHAYYQPKSFREMNFLGYGFLCFVYVALGILCYYRMLQEPTIAYLRDDPFFWINSAFFIYASSLGLLFLFDTYLKGTAYALLISVWNTFFKGMNILHYCLIGIGLYKIHKHES